MIIEDQRCNRGLWKKSVNGNITKSCATWHSMLNRCRKTENILISRPTYNNCTVSDNFKNFQYFAEWYINQIGYGIDNYALDKDLLFTGNKQYSENTCVLIPQGLNNFLLGGAINKEYPQGVSWHITNNRFQAHIRVDCKKIHLGYFADKESAENAYIEAKNRDAKRWYDLLSRGEYRVEQKVIERMKNFSYQRT